MRRQIYRKEALERMGSPEQLDQLMAVTGPRGWIALAGIGLLLLFVIVWSVLGQVATSVDGHGMLVRLGGIKTVPAPCDGAVAEISVQVGDTVSEGTELGQLIPGGAAGWEDAVSIRSPADGRVLDIAVFEGDIVTSQAILLTIESTECPLEAVVYVPAADGYCVQNAQDVRIELNDQRAAGQLRGHVRVAGKFPASRSGMTRSMYHSGWGDNQFASGPMLELIIELDSVDSESPLYSGTPCQAHVTVDRRRPIELVLPILNGREGG